MSDWLLIVLVYGSVFAVMWAAWQWLAPDDRDGDDQW